jgi:hypothetical protein
MKALFLFLIASSVMLVASAQGGDKSTRPSPPATDKETLSNGAVVSVEYSQPSIKGRTIGKDLEPMNGKIWRTGANEATVFEVSKAVKVEGKDLPAGKYALFTIAGDDEWTIIFNKTWKQWGAFNYKEADDALRVKVKPGKTKEFVEKMTIDVAKNGKVTLSWGNVQVDFKVD